MSSEPRVSLEDAANHLRAIPDLVCHRSHDRGLPARKFDRVWKFQLTKGNERVSSGGTDVHEADAEPKPKGKW